MPRIPVATYRLQLNHTFTFRDAARIVPYLITGDHRLLYLIFTESRAREHAWV